MFYVKRIFTLTLIAFLSACDASSTISVRSGTVDNAYVSEPLSERAIQFENALAVSNEMIEGMKFGDLKSIYNSRFDSLLASQVTYDDFVLMLSPITEKLGKMVAYKPMQWDFTTGKGEGVNLLYSAKIVEYEQGLVKYIFVFDSDGDYSKIIGFQFMSR